MLFQKRFLIHLNPQRLQKAAVLGRELGCLGPPRVALCQPDGGIQFQHDIVPVSTYAGNRTRNAIGIGHRVIDGVSQFTEQVFQVIIELQGWLSRTSSAILGPPIVGYKRASLLCLQYVHSTIVQVRMGLKSEDPGTLFVLSAAFCAKMLYYVHSRKGRRRAPAAGWFPASLARAPPAFSRGQRRRLWRSGAGLAQRRAARLDARRCSLAHRHRRAGAPL